MPTSPRELRKSLYDLTALLLAAGLDPERCILFRQSDVQEHTELCWLLCSVTELGRLQRMHQFRDKSLSQRELVAAGLLLYPVCRPPTCSPTAPHEVPVGEDQREHLELMRDVARRFNTRFGDGEEVLVVPEHRIPEVGARIMDLQDPTRKMSTTSGSTQGTVYVLDEPRAIEKKLKSAVTDSSSEVRRAPEKPGVSNLIEILAAVRAARPCASNPSSPSARYGEFKTRRRDGRRRAPRAGARALRAPARRRGRAGGRPRGGADRARAIASGTLADVRERMGVGAAAADAGSARRQAQS